MEHRSGNLEPRRVRKTKTKSERKQVLPRRRTQAARQLPVTAVAKRDMYLLTVLKRIQRRKQSGHSKERRTLFKRKLM